MNCRCEQPAIAIIYSASTSTSHLATVHALRFRLLILHGVIKPLYTCTHSILGIINSILWRHNSGGSRNLERGVRLAHTQRTAEGGAQSCEVVISPREARKNFLRVLFSDQEALS